MAMNDGSDGIAKLLAAEDEASEIVRKAREHRIKRLRQAKEAAELEIQEYRAAMQSHFDGESNTSTEASGDSTKELEGRTESQIKEIQDSYAKNKDIVMGMLLHHVTSVKVEVPAHLAEHLKAVKGA